jgi:hypothetical protein
VLYLLIEFQHSADPAMPERIMSYVGLLYQDLRKQGAVSGQASLPLVIPLVLYNGDAPWLVPLDVGAAIGELPPALERFRPTVPYVLFDETRIELGDDAPLQNLAAAVFRLEQPPDPAALLELGQELRRFLIDRNLADVLGDLSLWFRRNLGPRLAPDLPDPFSTGDSMLADRVQRWIDQYRAEGREEGREESREEGREEGVADGRLQMLYGLVARNLLTIDAARAEVARTQAAGLLTAEQAAQALARLG